MKNDPFLVSAADAELVGFVCPVYEWDVPEPVKAFIGNLKNDPGAYVFMVSTYVAIHGRCFETVEALLAEKGLTLHYGRALRCVASQCIACVMYCPKKAILYRTPEAYRQLDNAITRRMGLPENRTRYHNPHVTAKDLMNSGEKSCEPARAARKMLFARPFLRFLRKIILTSCSGCGIVCITCRTRGVFFVRFFAPSPPLVPYREAMPAPRG